MTTTFERETTPEISPDTVPPRYRLKPSFVPKSRYTTPEFLDLEMDRLFPRVWLIACREEELHDVGDYIEFVIGDQSIIVVRDASSTVQAFYNSCRHRGTRLVSGRGCVGEIRCCFHGWRWNLDGSKKLVLDAQDFPPRCDEDLNLIPVRAETWAGWVFINMDPDAESLLEFLDPLPTIFKPLAIEKMRYKWFKGTVFPMNWKMALDAFIESYHVPATHPQVLRDNSYGVNTSPMSLEDVKYRDMLFQASQPGRTHGNLGMMGRPDVDLIPPPFLMLGDPAAVIRLLQNSDAGFDRTPEFDLKAIAELDSAPIPQGTDPFSYFRQLRIKHATEAGIEWAELTPDQAEAIGIMWHVFPNVALFGLDPFGMIGIRFRPNGMDPNSCIFEVFVLHRVSTEQLSKRSVVEFQHFEKWNDHDDWGILLKQDFGNMAEIPIGMRSRGFDGYHLNPRQEGLIFNQHVVADRYLWNTSQPGGEG